MQIGINLNAYPMKLNKNLILEGPFSVEIPDTSGEVLVVAGADISSLADGQAHVNTEHIGPSDADNKDMHKDSPSDFQGFQTIIGRVKSAKKIFSEKDCASERELHHWNNFRKPMIYGQIELYDGPDAHENAKAASSLARMFGKIEQGPKFGLSVEGSTLERNGKILKRTVIRGLAGTLKPANKSATVDIVGDTDASRVSKSMSNRTSVDAGEPLRKSVAMQYMMMEEKSNDFGLFDALQNLRKTLTAGTPSSAPSALTGGAALQKESQLGKLAKLVGKKSPSAALIKTLIPGISTDDAAKIEKALKDRKQQDSLALTEKLYEEMFGKK